MSVMAVLRRLVGAAILAIWAPHAGADASWALLSEAKLLAESDVIVVGRMIGHETVAGESAAAPRTVGVIEVEGRLKGPAAPGDRLLLDVRQPDEPITDAMVFFKLGQHGLWYLRLARPGPPLVYAADHPQRFVSADEMQPRVEALRGN